MKEGLKICFWNIAGIINKCDETWEYLDNFDIIGLSETWIEEEQWKKIKDKMSNKFNWICTPAKENKKGRTREEIITVTRKDLKEVITRELSQQVEIKMLYNGNRWNIITVYSQNIEETIMETIMEYTRRERRTFGNRRRL